jgi:preprotein translocase subunit YajC
MTGVNEKVTPQVHFFDLSLVAQQSANGLIAILPFILILVILYVLMILPAQRRQKKLSAMIAALKNGDKVVTNGGIYGTVVGLDNESIQLRIAEQVKIRVARSAIAGLQPESKES